MPPLILALGLGWRGRPPWFERGRLGLLGRIALLPLSLVALLYASVAWAHRRLYAGRLRRPTRLACRVVSIGNVVVGGSGKTPATAWLATELRRRGHKVAIASRGYGRRGRERVLVVSDGRFVRARVEQSGDEPLLLSAHAPGVPVLVGRDRSVVGLRAIAAFGIDVLILDDGFQHHRLHRDVDLVAFDGSAGLGNRRCLPRGPLREPLSGLKSADGFLIVDGPLPEGDEPRIRRRAPHAPWFAAHRRAIGVRSLGGGEPEPADSLAGREVGLLSGIARPASLRRSVEGLGARVVSERSFPDHHVYRARDLDGLAGEAPLWVTTEKDAVKILPAWTRGVELRVLVIELELPTPEPFFDWLEARLRAARR